MIPVGFVRLLTGEYIWSRGGDDGPSSFLDSVASPARENDRMLSDLALLPLRFKKFLLCLMKEARFFLNPGIPASAAVWLSCVKVLLELAAANMVPCTA